MGPLTVTMGQSAGALTGRLKILGAGDFGEVLNLALTVDSSVTGPCAVSLSSTAPIAAPAAGATGTISVTTAQGCAWQAYPTLPWMAVTPSFGSGNGVVTYTVPPNYGPARQQTINIAGHLVTVTEDGVSNPTLAQAPALSTTSLNFGSLTVGASGAAQAVRLTNTGTTVLNLSAITIGGLNGGDFAETDGCGPALAAAGSCTIQVTFTPAAAGIRTASLFIAGNIGFGTSAVSLSGTGTATGPTPAIKAIVDCWGYTAGIAPGLWATIGGTNLAGPPQTWNLDGVQQLPVTLGSTTVTFNGSAAALLYVSPTQINALVPAGVAPGTVQVVVTVNGASSSPYAITAKSAQPAVYALPNADASTFFVTAALAGTATLVGNSGADPRVARAVYPGETLDLYMIGLGSTLDPSQFITDRVFAGAFPVSAPVTATVGGEAATVLFAGLTTPGLYLVRIVVPSDLSAGAQPLQVSVGGIQTRPSLALQMAAAPPVR
jgi:uncharacterized protein (TIGR03437 family)